MEPGWREGSIELGTDHWYRFFGWHPDRSVQSESWHELYDGKPDVERAGIIVGHLRADNGEQCEGIVTFNLPETEHLAEADHRWTVVSWEPLSIQPSVLCRACNDHGFITEGRWVSA